MSLEDLLKRKNISKKDKKEINDLINLKNKYENLINLIPETIYESDLKGNLTFVNDKAYSMFGYSKKDTINNLNILDMVLDEDKEKVKQNISKIIFNHTTSLNEYQLIKKDKSVFPALIHSILIKENEKPKGLMGLIIDISNINNLKDELINEFNYKNAIINTIPIYMVTIDSNKNVITMNDILLDKLGFSLDEVIGKDYIENFILESDKKIVDNMFNEIIINKKATNNQNYILTKNKDKIFVDWYAKPVFNSKNNLDFFLGLGIDITEKNFLYEKISEIDKLDSIGHLASGIAHDFNNILTGISGYNELLLSKEKDEKKINYHKKISKICDKGSSLTKKLLTFGKGNNLKYEELNLNEIVEDVYTIIKPSIKENIILKKDLSENIYNINGDYSKLTQLVLNLCVNANEAIKNEGILSLKTDNVSLNEYDLLKLPFGKTGDYVLLNVEDTGIGISKDLQKKIFNPFFTTKQNYEKKGTGLGLSVVYGIVKSHNAIIDVKSEINKGTSFDIYFPKI
ncbi:MAG: PAS domain-containing sensor histidine kinase, partial [Nanoarchaeota archaeon]